MSRTPRAKLATCSLRELTSRPHARARANSSHPGSCLFMAPENFLKKPYTAKVDVFAFGIIAVEVLARRRAYEGLFLLPGERACRV